MTLSSTSTLSKVWRPAAGESALLLQASERLHEEVWAGRVQSSSLRISHEVEIVPGCAVTVSCLPYPVFALVSPGPGREVKSWIGWTRHGKITRSGVRFFPGCSRCSWGLGTERIVPRSVGGPFTFFVLLFILVWTRHGCRATNRGGHCSLNCGGLSHP